MKSIRYVIYARKSSESEDKQMASITSQLDYLRKLARKEKFEVVMELDEAKSAKEPYKRDEFTRMLKLIESGKINGILCWQLNRLSRNPTESGMLQQLLQDEKLQVIRTHDRSFKPEDNALIFSVETGVANQFIRDLRVNVKRGIAQKVKSGGLSGPAPEGYLNNRLDKTIEIDPVRFPLIRKAFDMFLAGSSVQEIRRYLNEVCGYRTVKRKRVGGNPISRNSLYYMLANPRYAGKIPDPYTDEIHDADFPAMITEDEYNQIQIMLGSKGRPRFIKSKYFALKGLVRCGECGCMITAEEHSKVLLSGEIKKYTYYHCTHRRPCSQRSNIKEEDLFSQLEDLLSQYEISPKLYEWGMEAIAEIAKHEKKNQASVKGMQILSLNEVEGQLDNLIDLATKGFITADEFGVKSKPLKEELRRLQAEQNEAAERARNWYDAISTTISFLNGATEKFANGDILDKKQILLAIGKNPVLIDGKLAIDAYKWLIPIKNEARSLNSELEKVRNAPQQIQNAAETSISTKWYADG